MSMTTDTPLARLHAKRAALTRQHAQALANLHALDGGIQAIDQLIAEATAAPPESAENPALQPTGNPAATPAAATAPI